MSGKKSMEHDYTDTSPLLKIPKICNSNKLTSGIDDIKRKDNIPSLSLFHCVNPFDTIMLMFATLLKVTSGFAIPCTILVAALSFDEFIYYQIAKNEEYFCNQSIKKLENYITTSAPDNFLENEVTRWMYYMFGIATIYVFSSIASHTLWSYSTLKITDRFRVSFLQSILSKDVTWYDLNPLTELSTYITDNMQIIESGIGESIPEFLEDFSTIILGYILAMFVSWKLSIVMSLLVVMTLTEMAVVAKVAGTQSYKRQSALSKAGSIAEEMLTSIRTVVAFGGQTKGTERYQISLSKAKHESYKLHLAVAIAAAIGAFCSFTFYALGIGYGSFLFLNCDITLGEILTVIMLFATGNVVIHRALPSLAGIGGVFGSFKNISNFLDQEPQLDTNISDGIIPNSFEGSVQFSNVVFSYPSRPDVQVLKGLDLNIKPGQTVALVGPSGCGKSTIVKLLMRIYDCNGSISVDGTDVKQLNIQWLRNQIGIVSQEPFLFNVSIAENIRYGKESATIEELEKASVAANAHDFISELPEGYNTLVGDGGIQLSGGQKQRVAIARSLVSDPKIILLDEATSALDTENEKIVQEALDKARVGRTTIIIAHRLSTIKTSDVIMSMDKGHIIEIGSHSELMDNKGLYYELVMSQTIEDENDKISATHLSEDFPLITPCREFRESKIKQPYSSSTYINLDQEHAEINQHNSASITEVFKLNKNNWCLPLIGLICIIIPGIILAVVIAILSEALDQLGETESDAVIQSITPFVVYFLLVSLSLAVLFFFGYITIMVAGEKFTEVLRLKMFRAILRQDMAWFDRSENTAGILTTKLAVHPTQVNKVIGYPFALMIQGVTSFLTGTVILFSSSWVLGLILFPVYIVAVSGQVLQVFLTQKSLVKIDSLMGKSSKVAVGAIGAIQTVTSLEIKHIIKRLYEEKLRKSFKYKVMSRIVQSIMYRVTLSVAMYSSAVALRVSVFLYLSDASKVYHIDKYKQVCSAILVVVLLSFVCKTAFLAIPDYQNAFIAAGQINAILQRNPTIDSQSTVGQELDECHGDLTLKQLHFSYPSRPKVPVLQDINIHIEPGQTLALVGSSGSGKSTIISLTERFYDPTAGGLLLDGIDLCDFNIPWLHQQISLVSQEPDLFNISIADNIRYGGNFREISDKEVVDAAMIANIHDFIQSLPQGYNTTVGLKGSQLSGGQKQRIAIARALVQDPKILLLDEATSALDTETEKIVQDALNKAREGHTTIIVAHRLSTIYNSDKIVVLQKGHVVEEGTHSELMDKQGTYYLMNKIQNF